MVTDSGYLPSSLYIGILGEHLDTPKMNFKNLVCTFSRISTFSYPHTSQPYDKIGSTHLSNNLSITSVGGATFVKESGATWRTEKATTMRGHHDQVKSAVSYP